MTDKTKILAALQSLRLDVSVLQSQIDHLHEDASQDGALTDALAMTEELKTHVANVHNAIRIERAKLPVIAGSIRNCGPYLGIRYTLRENERDPETVEYGIRAFSCLVGRNETLRFHELAARISKNYDTTTPQIKAVIKSLIQ